MFVTFFPGLIYLMLYYYHFDWCFYTLQAGPNNCFIRPIDPWWQNKLGLAKYTKNLNFYSLADATAKYTQTQKIVSGLTNAAGSAQAALNFVKDACHFGYVLYQKGILNLASVQLNSARSIFSLERIAFDTTVTNNLPSSFALDADVHILGQAHTLAVDFNFAAATDSFGSFVRAVVNAFQNVVTSSFRRSVDYVHDARRRDNTTITTTPCDCYNLIRQFWTESFQALDDVLSQRSDVLQHLNSSSASAPNFTSVQRGTPAYYAQFPAPDASALAQVNLRE